MRFILAFGAVFLIAGSAHAQSAPAQPPPAQVPVPGAPAPGLPAEDPERLKLEAQLKELQRREQFDTMDLKSRQVLLKRIIDACIELGRDFSLYLPKLKEVEEALKKQETLETRKQRKEQANKILKSRALQAMTAVPPRWSDAARDLNDANRLVPNDPETLGLKAEADREVRQILIYRVILGTLVTLVTIGALIALVKSIRKGALKGGGRVRRLEMIEGPQPGETFQLEKEITTLGAVAAEADWAIPDPSRRMSRRHCDISRSGRHYFLTDYSSNGTFINGKQIAKGEPVLLRRGDRIGLAEDIVLRFR